jgi:hypothetical protein
VRTLAVPRNRILLPTWDRSGSSRDFVLSKHPWQTTLSAAQKSKFLSVNSDPPHRGSALRCDFGLSENRP